MSTVHCLFGGVAPAVHCRARCRKSRKKRRGARRSCSSSSSRRRGDRRAAAAGHGTAARRSRAAATAAHPTTPSAAPRRPSVAPGLCTHMLSPLSSLKCHTVATQAQAAAGGANSASHRTWRSVRAGAQAPASTSRQLRRGQIPGERRRRRPGLPGDTAAASLRTKSARVLPALASSGRTSTSSARISTGPARC